MFTSSGILRPGPLSSKGGNIDAIGGTIVDSGGYRHHIFSTVGSNTLTYKNAPIGSTVQVLCIGGGGSGRGNLGGGGGAGGIHVWASVDVGGRTTSAITVGAGGRAAISYTENAENGGNSVFTGNTTLTAGGGGAAGSNNVAASNGGSGGGAGGDWGSTSSVKAGGTANGLGTGNAGGNAGGFFFNHTGAGGGGYSGAGISVNGARQNGGSGGQGAQISTVIGSIYSSFAIFSGMTYVCSGGGGAGGYSYQFGYYGGGAGGTGAGNGGSGDDNATAATAFGCGGGGGSYDNRSEGVDIVRPGKNGYQGLVIVRYVYRYL